MDSSPAEPVALKRSFSYLVSSIDTAALLPAALSRNLITDRQRVECYNEADSYKKAETFVGYLQRAVNTDYINFHIFVQILQETGQGKIASRLRDELAHSFRSMQQPSVSNTTDESAAETDFAVVKEHIKQQGSVDVLSLKSYLIGPSRVGKTTTRRRLTGEIGHLSPDKIVPSTGIDVPLTVQLYRADANTLSTALFRSANAWQSQGLKEQFQTLYSYILNNIPSTLSSTISATALQDGEDAVTSLIEENGWEYIKENASLEDIDALTFIHFIDIGGQPEFHEMLPLLLHQGPALNLLFLNMSQSLNGKYQVVYRDDSGSSPIDYKCEFTTKEIIQRALHSISSLQPIVNHSKPAAILIGTHYDKDPQADLEQSIQDTFSSFIEDAMLCSVSKPEEEPVRYVHPLSNVSKGDSSADSNTDIEDLRERITTIVHDRFKFEPVPTATLLLYLKLRTTFDPIPGWCSIKECVKIGASFGISEEDLTKEGGILQYLHDRFGTILYYRGLKIGQRVIVNPNLVMRPPAELFMTAFGAKTSEHTTAERIRRTGEIPHRLMEKVCSSNKGQSTVNEIPTDEIVQLLKSRYILYENAQLDSEKHFYFLPCLLYPDHKVDEQSRDLCHLNSLTYPPILLIPETGYVPLGPFPATVVKLSQSSHWRLAETEISIQNAERSRFRNRIRFYFQLPQEKMLDVELRALSTHLELRIRHNASSKLINPRLIPECLRELRISFDEVLFSFPHTQDWKWDLGFYCPHAIQSGQRPHPARCNTKDKPQDVICSQRNCKNGPVDLDDKHKCWFTEIVIVPNQSLQVSDDHEEPSCKYKDPLTVKQLVKAVASVSDWFTLGLYLGLEPAELNEIRTTHHLDGVNTLKAMMFDKWLKKCPAASWDDVIDALIDLDEFTAADRVRAGRPQKSLPKKAACEDAS